MKKIIFLVSSACLLFACATTDKSSEDAGVAFEAASEPYHDGNYEIAINKLGEFKSRFPYSHYAAEAELLIANSNYELKRYAEAIESYSQFVKLHPQHSQVDFAHFRIGESYWAESPETIDREQDYTAKAIEKWQELLKVYPDSQYSARARELIQTGEERIAKSYEFISTYYCKQEIWHACAYRSLKLIESYPQFKELVKSALSRAARALEKMVENRKTDQKDSNYFFKTMTEAEILQKAKVLRTRAENI